RQRELRPDRLDPDLGRHRVAQRRYRGVGRALPDLHAARLRRPYRRELSAHLPQTARKFAVWVHFWKMARADNDRRPPLTGRAPVVVRYQIDVTMALSMRRSPVSASNTWMWSGVGASVTTSPAIGWLRPSTRTTNSWVLPSISALP